MREGEKKGEERKRKITNGDKEETDNEKRRGEEKDGPERKTVR